MYNLSDLQDNLKKLIKEVRDIQQSLRQPHSHAKGNQAKMILKMPTLVLLTKICCFLNIKEINELSNTCKAIRKKIYSPLGLRVLTGLKSPYPITIIYIDSQENLTRKRVSFEENHYELDDFEDQKFIEKEQLKYKIILTKKYDEYNNSKEKYQALGEKVRVEKHHIFKMRQQFNFFSQIKDDLKQENNSHKDRLKKLSQGFSKRIQEMDERNDQLSKERTKLQNQKQALAGRIREYQHEIQLIRQDSQKSKQILKRLKNYLLYKQL